MKRETHAIPATAISENSLCEALDLDGYIVVTQALDEHWLVRLRLAFENAPVQSSGTQHVEILEETPELDAWLELAHHPAVVAAADHVLSRPYHVAGLHGRNPLPGFGQQGLHADWTRTAGEPYRVLTTLWMLDDFTTQNGATRVVPGTHRFLQGPSKSLAQPLARHPDEKIITGLAGSVLIFNGYLWHSGRRNESSGPRRAVQMALHRGAKTDANGESLSPINRP